MPQSNLIHFPAPRLPARPTRAAPKRVLVIDDNPASTRLTRLTLERIATCSILELNHSLRALDTAQSFRPDLVLLDVEMPGLDGATVWRQLRADPGLRRVPIIFLTSLVTEAEASLRRFDGNTRVLAKPLTLAKLAATVASQLGDLCAAPPRHPVE